jgi:flagellar hook assembly protein FlgD
VVIKIYNVTGQLVRIIDIGQKAAGAYVSKEKAAYWNGRNESGEQVSSGVYFYLMETGSFRGAKKMLIIR